jgi:hypothetical protein
MAVASMAGQAYKGSKAAKAKAIAKVAEEQAFRQGMIQAAYERKILSSETIAAEAYASEAEETEKKISAWNSQATWLGVGGAAVLILAIVVVATPRKSK